MKTMINTFAFFLFKDIPTHIVEKNLTLNETLKIQDIQLQVFVLKLLSELNYPDGKEKNVVYLKKVIKLLEEKH